MVLVLLRTSQQACPNLNHALMHCDRGSFLSENKLTVHQWRMLFALAIVSASIAHNSMDAVFALGSYFYKIV